jgi:hypothetical protein
VSGARHRIGKNVDLIAMALDKLAREEARKAREAAQRERERVRRERIERIRAEHTEAMRRPLISADVLSHEERAEIRERVRSRKRPYSW